MKSATSSPNQAPSGLPYLLDFYPLQAEEHTRISPFFDTLREGRLSTTRCQACRALHWQPRVVCPECLSDQVAWEDLPTEGTLFAFTALEKGAPMGMDRDVPFCIGVVDLQVQGRTLRILSRLDEARFEDLKIGDRVKLRVLELDDGRVFYRFAPVK